MTFGIFVAILFGGIALGVGGLYVVTRQRKPKARKAKRATPWLTRNQLEVLDAIRMVDGIRLWYTDLSVSTIRSLSKRGLLDTAPGGRIVVTRAGRKRLKQPWPDPQSTGDQNGRNAADDVGSADNVDSGASQADSGLGGL